MKITLNRSQWEQIGKVAGWTDNSIQIGPTPYEEPCAQVSKDEKEYSKYMKLNQMEYDAFSKQLLRMFPNPPPGVSFYRASNPHDFGDYHEVAIRYKDRAGAEYAANIEENTPANWDGEALLELSNKGYFVLKDQKDSQDEPITVKSPDSYK